MIKRFFVLVLLALVPSLAGAQTEVNPQTGLPIGWERFGEPQTDECNGLTMTVHWIVDETQDTGSESPPQVKKIRCELIPTPQGEALLQVASYRCGMTHVIFTTHRINLEEPWGDIEGFYPCYTEALEGNDEPIFPVSSRYGYCYDGGFYDFIALIEHEVPREDAYRVTIPHGCDAASLL